MFPRPPTVVPCSAALLAVAAACSITSAGTSLAVELSAQKDATLTQDLTEELGSGASEAIFAGRVGAMGGGLRRRALIQFDVASAVPEGATIVATTLVLQMTQTASGSQTVSLHRAAADWGEGPSVAAGGQGVPAEPGDSTWGYRFYESTAWTSPGGDYVAAASASIVVNQTGSYSWSTDLMRADVQAWLDDPSANHGWLVRGNESATKTVKKFASRESLSADYRPRLVVEYEPPPACASGDLDCDGDVDAADLAILLGAWGTVTPGDLDGSGTVDGADLAALLGAWTG